MLLELLGRFVHLLISRHIHFDWIGLFGPILRTVHFEVFFQYFVDQPEVILTILIDKTMVFRFSQTIINIFKIVICFVTQ